MSRGKKFSLLFLWLFLGTHIYGYIWSTHLDSFPELPERVGHWIAALTGMTDSQDAEQLALYYVLIVSFVVVAGLTLVGAGIYYLIRRALRTQVQ